jgi:phosphomevalonate kinase
MICRTPGKIVLWGEYAVLAGAPAAVMAIDRYARVELTKSDSGWRFESRGFLTPSLHNFTGEFTHAPVAKFAETALQRIGNDRLVEPFSYIADSSDFFARGNKLGLGSSAAVCTATYVALARWLDHEPNLATALQLHANWQGGSGSGLDVTTSWHGGVISYQIDPATDDRSAHLVKPLTLPPDLKWQVVWTGASASTQSAIGRFSQWRQSSDTRPLDQLADATTALSKSIGIDGLANYRQCLLDFDHASKLKIFTPEHDQLGKIATDFGLVYKPCGAGGGDIGVAFGNDFSKRVDDTPFHTLRVEIAEHGVEVSD